MTENKYSRGKIYRLVNNIDDKFYIGSTCETLARRKSSHKASAKHEPNRNVYNHLNIIGWENVDIILIENYSCKSIEELNARERYWIEQLKPTLNKVIPLRTRKERDETNQHKIKEQNKEYRERNKERIKQRDIQYNKRNYDKRKQNRTQKIKCECGREMCKYELSRHKKTKTHQQWLSNQPSTSS